MISRRQFGSIAAGSVFALANLPLNAAVADPKPPAGEPLSLDLHGYPYDRVQGLADGRVKINGRRCDFHVGRIGDMNTHVFGGPQTRAVSEVGLAPFLLAVANQRFRDYLLLPIFPLRVFRHKSIFIRTDRNIRQPADLRGKRVATPGYSSTSLTWIRGMLQHEYGVRPDQVEWVLARKESSAAATGSASELERVLPKGLNVRQGSKGKDESQLLADGDVDAVFHAAEPQVFQDGHPKVARLFEDSRSVEQAYFKKTGIFPIMHAVALRRDLAQANPWLAAAVFQAYSQAKGLAYQSLKREAWYLSSLPWVAQEAEATRKLMGENFYSYGARPNRKTLEALMMYLHEQGLAARRLKLEDVFDANLLKLEE